MSIQVLKPSCTQAELDAVNETLKSAWWGQGKKCDQFERRIAKRHGYKYAVSVNSATAALHLACIVNGIGPGDEVIVPALTFISTALAVSYCGAKPIFADVEEDTLCIDWVDVYNKMTPKTKAIIPVDYAGYPAFTSGVNLGVTIIQDAAHATGGTMYGDEVCLSFHPVKPLATGDGGCILTNDEAKAERLRALRWCGIDRSTWERSGKKYGWDYDISEIGYKCHWNDVQAAIGLVQLDRLTEMQARRRTIAARYDCQLEGLVQLSVWHNSHTFHLYPIRVDADKRDALIDYLAEKGVGAGVHYRPLTTYPMYSDQPTPPVTEREWQRLISLPIYVDMTDEEQAQVIKAVKGFFGCS